MRQARSPAAAAMPWAAASTAPRSTGAGGVHPRSAGIAASEPAGSHGATVRTRDSAPARPRASRAGVRARSSAVGPGRERLARAVEDDERRYHSMPCWARIP